MGVVAAIGAGRVAAVDHREVATAQVSHHRLVGGAVVGRLELALAVDRRAGGIVFADVDVGRGAAARYVVVVIVETHHEAAARQRAHLGHVLTARGALVDLELAAELVARRIEALAVNTPGAGTVLVVGRPHHHEATVGEHRHAGSMLPITVVGLVAGRCGIDQEAAAEASRAGIVDTRKNTVAAAVVGTRVGPHDDVASIGPGGHVRHVLGTRLRRGAARRSADQGLAALLGADVVKALRVDVVAVGPHRSKTAAVARHVAVVLRARGRGVEQQLRALRCPRRIEALSEAAPAAAVIARAVLPADDEAAVRQGRDLRPALVAIDQGIDAELRPQRLAVVGEALGVDTPLTAILSVGVPSHHIAAIGQGRHRRPLLRARGVGVDHLFGPHPRRAVILAHHLYADLGGGTRAAVTVVHAHRDATACLRTVRSVGIGQVLQQLLDRIHAGTGIELDHQRSAVAAATDRAYRYRTAAVVEAHGAARNADLADARALVVHTELILHATETSVKNLDTATIEVRGVGVVKAEHRINDLRRRIDGVLSQHQCTAKLVQLRVGLARHVGRIAEQALVDRRMATVDFLVV